MNRHERTFVFPLIGKDSIIKAKVVQEEGRTYIPEWQLTTSGDGSYECFLADALETIAKRIRESI